MRDVPPAVPLRLLLPLLARPHARHLDVLAGIRAEVGPVAWIRPLDIVVVSDGALALEALRDTRTWPDKALGLREARHYLGDGRLSASADEWKQSCRDTAALYAGAASARSVAAAGPALERRLATAEDGPLTLQPILDRVALEAALAPLFPDLRPAEAELEAILADLRMLSGWSRRSLRLPVGAVAAVAWRVDRKAGAALVRIHRRLDEWGADRSGSGSALAAIDERRRRAELTTLLVAATETTSACAAFAVDRVCRRPALAEALASGAESRTLLRRIVFETLRLHPPVWAITRRTARDGRLGPWRLRPGQQLLIDIVGVHRDDTVWPEPERFDPSRFAAPAPAGFIPFGAGPRQCIGRKAGLEEAEAIVGHLFTGWRVQAEDPEPPLTTGLALRPALAGRYRIRRR